MPTRPPRHLADMTRDERRAAAAALGEPPFRGDQLSRHYFSSFDADPSAMTDLPKPSRVPLTQAMLPALLEPLRHLSCDEGRTRKTLWRAGDATLVESVLMRYPGRTTVCVSSQAGCGMGCPFCATGQAGLTRNLSTAEIIEQVVATNRAVRRGELAGVRELVSNVVFMGMGEPLANYRTVVAALRRLSEPTPYGLGLSQRSITLSTVGLAPAIRRLAGEGLSVRLAVSLHAPDDELRDRLVPVNRRYPVAEVLDAAFAYAAGTHRRLSIEYTLIEDVNDQQWRARLLGRLLRGRPTHVNLIPLNPTRGSDWRAAPESRIANFAAGLVEAGVPTTVRDTRGREIDGACGQLAAGTP
ncbi:MAG: 23S rRNA (adenine(2503)-C(2))-methyltransferase RlmN [Mycobacteriales bacterium]